MGILLDVVLSCNTQIIIGPMLITRGHDKKVADDTEVHILHISRIWGSHNKKNLLEGSSYCTLDSTVWDHKKSFSLRMGKKAPFLDELFLQLASARCHHAKMLPGRTQEFIWKEYFSELGTFGIF